MEKPTYNAGDNVEIVAPNTKDSNGSCTTNIILNHDFSEGLHFWHPNCCDGLVVSAESAYPEGISENSRGSYAVVTNRKECWQGLEQDITARVLPGSTYTVSACVGVSGPLHGSVDVLATLKLDYRAQGTGFWFFVNTTRTSFLSIGRTSVSKDRWGKLEGTFSLQPMPDQVVFYFEGPSPGIDLLIKSALITCSNPSEHEVIILFNPFWLLW